MIIPVRCFSCGKVTGNLWDTYSARLCKGEAPDQILNDLNVHRYCCRRMIITSVNLLFICLENHINQECDSNMHDETPPEVEEMENAIESASNVNFLFVDY